MKKDYSKYIGKRMTWKQMKEMFPQRRIALSEYEFTPNLELIGGKIQAICTEEEDIGDYTEQIVQSNPGIRIYWVRTTELLCETILWEDTELVLKSMSNK
jgi:hypothetical protein